MDITIAGARINRIVSTLIIADLALLAGWGLVNPIFSVFVVDEIAGGSLAAIGIAVAIYWFTRAGLQIPIASYLDRTKGEKDEFRALGIGCLLAAGTAFLFPLASTVMHLYILKFLHAVAFSFYVPAWSGVFSKHLDSKHTALEWAIDRSAGGFATGVSGLIGGVIAGMYGFSAIFVIAGIASLVAGIAVLFGPTIVFPHARKSVKAKKEQFSHPHNDLK